MDIVYPGIVVNQRSMYTFHRLPKSEPMNIEIEHPTTVGRARSSDAGFVRRLTLTLVSIFVIMMSIISIAWFVMDKHDPGFHVMSLSVSNFTVSADSKIGGKYEVKLTITNPNKKIQVLLDRFQVLVFYGEVGLSMAAVQPVYLEKMANKSVNVEFVVMRDSTKLVSEKLVKEWNKGVVNFNVKMLVRARFEAGVWPSREKFLDVYCGDLDVGFFSPKDTGKLLGIGKDCSE
ncbi:hypothetical protein RIF29_31662 [Crotalaria pallida]|uniref:Late embryogenesis abundant protein LEA-2 subgroup domain-containing protein n=1 Tax=Crotalaria pallida TaxID=3830 RepID=A0AAN9HYY9_CROPI